MKIATNVASIRERMARARESRKRETGDVTLVGVTKSVDCETALRLIDAGVTDIGENRLPEFTAKSEMCIRERLDLETKVHFIGHLQRNKVPALLSTGHLHLLQSLDSQRLAEVLEQRAQVSGQTVDTLIEVKTSPEATKHGLDPDDVLFLSRMISAECKHLRVCGLMTMAPFTNDLRAVRSSFDMTWDIWRELSQLALPRVEMRWLSMGMSDDFEEAIRAGSNMIRVGRALFV